MANKGRQTLQSYSEEMIHKKSSSTCVLAQLVAE